MERKDVLNFACQTECADYCCTGATLITIEEIRHVYDVFPITVGFRNYVPVSADHRDLLEMVGFREGARYVVGDFVAGNRLGKRCPALRKDRLCRLHREGRKPLQCRLVPFSALYPEEIQDMVLAEQKKGVFAGCRGFLDRVPTDHTVWRRGSFTEPVCREAYLGFQRGLGRQKSLMKRLLDDLRRHRAYPDFLKGEGILEASLPVALLFEVLDSAGFAPEEQHLFIREQGRLCRSGKASAHPMPKVLDDYLATLDKVTLMYAEFLGRRKKAGRDSAGGGA